MTQLILYTSEDGKSQIQLCADGQTIWLPQMEMAESFSATKQNISLHLKNVFADGELAPVATVKESLTVQSEGMSFWHENVGQIITANAFPLLSGAGSISHARMERKVETLFLDYDQRRKSLEAQAADAQDEAELKALENSLKRRPKP